MCLFPILFFYFGLLDETKLNEKEAGDGPFKNGPATRQTILPSVKTFFFVDR